MYLLHLSPLLNHEEEGGIEVGNCDARLPCCVVVLIEFANVLASARILIGALTGHMASQRATFAVEVMRLRLSSTSSAIG